MLYRFHPNLLCYIFIRFFARASRLVRQSERNVCGARAGVFTRSYCYIFPAMITKPV